MAVHLKPEETRGYHSPESLGLVYCSVERVEIAGTELLKSGDEELCLVCIAGKAFYQCGGESGEAVLCDMLYVPVRSDIILSGDGAVFMRFGAPCSRQYQFKHISFSEVNGDSRHKVYGKAENGTLRDVWNFIDEKFGSGRFLTGICFGRDGGWTAWPPHEHGAEREEVYVYFNMGESFGLQCVYNDLDQAEAHVVREGHLIAIPEGYHPNCGCPCGGIRYVYCMVSVKEGDRDFMNLRTQKIYGDRLE